MTTDKESLYWHTKPEWWFINKDGEYELTENAPERARKSFEIWWNS